MAENLDDGEFWLPPKFLNDVDTSFNPQNGDVFAAVSRAMFPYMTSPVDSSETESDEEEQQQQQHQLAELTRHMARSSLGLDLSYRHSFAAEKPKGSVKSGSPQSTLSAIGSSGKGSSPNDAVYQANSQEATWDLLRAAAGEVERMRLNEEQRYAFVKHSHGVGFFSQQQQPSLSQHQQLQIAQFEMLRQQQMAKQQHQHQQQGAVWACGGVQGRSDQMVPNRGRINSNSNSNVRGGGGVMGLSSSAWPSLQHAKHHQQQFGSGMRAVFLENPSVKKERTGTGVFLPRSANAPSESRKKPGCSTVLVPDRVAQALNLNLDGGVVGRHQRHQHHHHHVNGVSNIENASAVPRVRSSYGVSQQKQNLRPQPPANHEIQLPQEWTY